MSFPVSKFLVAVQGLVSVVLLSALIWWLQPARLYAVASALHWPYVLCAAGLSLVGLWVQAEKWRALLSCTIPDVDRRQALFSVLAGLGFGLITPGRLGELGRGYVLPADRTRIALLTVADRGLSMLVTLALGCAALAWLAMYEVLVWGLILLFAAALAILGGRFLVYKRRWKQLEMLSLLWGSVPLATWGLSAMWSFCFNMIFLGQFFLLLCSYYTNVREVALLGPALFAIKSVLPVSFLDLGVREGVAVWLFTHRGLDPLPAFNASLVVFALNVALPGALGWLVVGRAALRSREFAL